MWEAFFCPTWKKWGKTHEHTWATVPAWRIMQPTLAACKGPSIRTHVCVPPCWVRHCFNNSSPGVSPSRTCRTWTWMDYRTNSDWLTRPSTQNLSIHASTHPSIHLSLSLSLSLYLNPSIYLSIHPSIYLSSIHPSIHLSTYLPIPHTPHTHVNWWWGLSRRKLPFWGRCS